MSNETYAFTNNNGNKVVVNPALNNKANSIAQLLLNKAKKAEPQVTKDLLEITKGTSATISYDQEDDNGVVRNSLTYRLKTKDSLSDKLKGDANYIINKIGNEPIYDALRYTALVNNPDMLVKSYNSITLNLEKRGYNVYRCKNTLNKYSLENPYRGINTIIKTPKGYKFELQFHTKDSLWIKEENHKLYKTLSNNMSEKERIKILDKMFKNSQKLKDIPGAGTIREIKPLKKEAN